MLQLPGILKEAGMITLIKEFHQTAGMERQNVYDIKKGRQRFTVSQIQSVGKKYGIDFNWIFGVHNNNPFMADQSKSRVS